MKVNKYDRQIRLWGPKGQRKLGQAKVALVGCSGTGIQALKNLVLPGIGEIHIWDNTRIEVKDLASSFFYEHTSVSSLKGQEALKNLLQMNNDVCGKFFNQSFQEFITSESIQNYTLIIFGNNLTPSEIKQSSAKLYELNIPAIYLHTVGHYFYVRLQKKIHFVESSNSQASKKYYLNIKDPFKQLEEYSSKNNIYQLISSMESLGEGEDQKKREILRIVGNIPYPIVLLQVCKKIQTVNRAGIEKQLKEVKEKIHEKYRDNVNEALNRILDVFQTSDNFMNSFNLIDPAQDDTTLSDIVKSIQNKETWPSIIKFLMASKQFLKRNKRLPQPTNLPDMHTTTENYLSLKNIYKEKHHEDIQELIKWCQQAYPNSTYTSGKQPQNCPSECITAQVLSQYINNIENLQIVKMRSYQSQLLNPNGQTFMYTSGNQQALYVALRAFEEFQEQNKQCKLSFQELKAICHKKILEGSFNNMLLNGFSESDKESNMKLLDKYLQDICRSQGINSNIHICSMGGAIAAQEAIKLISGCFTPMNAGYLFDGANGAGYTISI